MSDETGFSLSKQTLVDCVKEAVLQADVARCKGLNECEAVKQVPGSGSESCDVVWYSVVWCSRSVAYRSSEF